MTPSSQALSLTCQEESLEALLATILCHGNLPGSSQIQQSLEMLEYFGGLTGIQRASAEELVSKLGGNGHKAALIRACFSLGWRMVEQVWRPGDVLRGSEQVYRAFRCQMTQELVEVVWVLLLDSRLRRMGALEISRGTVNGAIVHPREVLRPVITRGATAFILLHNHPSGDPEPSPADLRVTREISQAAAIFQVDFLDHIIFGQNHYWSMADRRQI